MGKKDPLTVKRHSEEEKQRRHLHGTHLQTRWVQIRPESHSVSGWDQDFLLPTFCSLFSFHLKHARAHTRVTQTTDGVGGGGGLGGEGAAVEEGVHSLCTTPATVSGEGDTGLFYFERGPLFEPPCWYLWNDSAVCFEFFFVFVFL